MTKRIFKSYGVKHKQHYTGSDYHRRKTQRRVHTKVKVTDEYATFTISKANTGWIFKSNFNDPREQKLYKDLVLFFTKNDPNYLVDKIQIPYERVGWGQEYIVNKDVDFLNTKILLGEQAKNITFKLEDTI